MTTEAWEEITQYLLKGYCQMTHLAKNLGWCYLEITDGFGADYNS